MDPEQTPHLQEIIEDLLNEGAAEELAAVLSERSPAEVADLLEHLGTGERIRLFQALPATRAGEVASLLDDAVREDLVELIAPERLAEMLSSLDADEALSILEDAPSDTAENVLQRLDPEDALELRELLGYDEESAGRAMAYGAPAVRLDQTVGEALDALAAEDDLEDLHVPFVVDGIGRLRGYLPLRALLLRPRETPVADVVERRLPFAYTYEDQETAISRIRHSPVPAIPVVDERGLLKGQITPQRISEIVEEERSEDMYRLAGLSEEESVYGSLRDSLAQRTRSLLPWLVPALLTAAIVSRFEGTIAAVAILAAFQNALVGLSSQAGTQTLTLVVSGLALGEVDWRNTRRLLGKECAIGLLNGTGAGCLLGGAVALWRDSAALGLLVGGSLCLNMVAAVLAAFAVPLLLKARRRDPAQASSVIVAAVSQSLGLLFFLGLATAMLPWLK